MKQYLYNYLSSQSGALTSEQVGLNFLMALIIGGIIYISYHFSHSGVVYSSRFNISLVMLTIITTLVMTVIGNNVALSLGMVGALSIVRFRTVIKDPRDTAYIFWCIAAGICCGVSEFFVAGIGTSILFLFLLVFGRIQSNDRYLLVIRGARKTEKEIETAVSIYYSGKARMRVKNTSPGNVELIYELSQKTLDRIKNQDKSITDKLYGIEGMDYVNLVSQNDEINR